MLYKMGAVLVYAVQCLHRLNMAVVLANNDTLSHILIMYESCYLSDGWRNSCLDA